MLMFHYNISGKFYQIVVGFKMASWLILVGLLTCVCARSKENDLILDLRGGSKLSAKFSELLNGHKIGVHLSASGQGFLVKTLANRHLVSMQVLPDKKSQLIKILNTAFLQSNNNDYLIPRNLYGEANSISDSRDIHTFVGKLQKNAARTQASNSAYKSAIRRLSGMQESRLILQASEALGDAGITGASHPHMLPLYMFATRLPQATRQQQRQGEDRRSPFEVRVGVQRCSRPKRDACNGMCGYGCYCWNFVCGDCCFHKGCYEHDLCCRGNFLSPRCLFLPYYGFSCTHYSGYPRCM